MFINVTIFAMFTGKVSAFIVDKISTIHETMLIIATRYKQVHKNNYIFFFH